MLGEKVEKAFEEKIIEINRLSKKTKGGNRIRFSALVVVGDKKGKVGVGLGKAADVRGAIQKGIGRAKKNLMAVNLSGVTIPHEIKIKKGAAKVFLKPAPPGSGVIAGGVIRSIAELAGIKDLSAKIIGTRTKTTNAYATVAALQMLKSEESGSSKKAQLGGQANREIK